MIGLLTSSSSSCSSSFVMVEGLAGVLAAAGDSTLAGDSTVDTVGRVVGALYTSLGIV